MVRTILGVLAGYAVWSIIWLGGNAALFARAAEVIEEGDFYGEGFPLLGMLVLSAVCSLAAGFVATKVDRLTPGRAVMALGVALVATGVWVQYGVWDQMPIWYHLAFLGLLIPMTAQGSRLAK